MKANQMIKRRRTTLLRVFLTFLTWTGVGVGLTSCTDDSDEPRISGVEASVDAPVLSFVVEDADGRDLLANADGLSVRCWETGEPLPYSIEDTEMLSWQRRQKATTRLLTVTLPTPYHSQTDKEYVYTLDPTLVIAIDALEQPIVVKTRYDYDLHYEHDGNGNRIAEADTLHVQLRFPEADDALPTLQWDEDAKQWTGGDLQCRVQLDGRIIAKPHETLSTSRHAEKVVTPEGQVVDSTYRAIDFCMSLPRIYSLEGDTSFTYFPIWLFMQSPQLFGDNAVHSVYMVLNQTAADVGQKQMNLWNVYFDGNNSDTPSQYISSPYRINLNWK